MPHTLRAGGRWRAVAMDPLLWVCALLGLLVGRRVGLALVPPPSPRQPRRTG